MKNKIEKLIKKNGFKILDEIEMDIFGRYHGVVINNNGDRFFVKAATGKESYKYKSLWSEINITRYLYTITKKETIIKNGYQLTIPKIERVLKNEEMLCLISEYIDSKRLLDQPSDLQAQMIVNTLGLVEKLDGHAELGKIAPQLKTYTRTSLLWSVPVKLAKALSLSPNLTGKLLITALKTLPIINNSSNRSLVHADINASNIFFDDKKIYLIDWEEAGWGISEYNTIVPLSVHWKDKIIRETLLEKLRDEQHLITALLAYRTLVLLNQKIDLSDSRRLRDLKLLGYITN